MIPEPDSVLNKNEVNVSQINNGVIKRIKKIIKSVQQAPELNDSFLQKTELILRAYDRLLRAIEIAIKINAEKKRGSQQDVELENML